MDDSSSGDARNEGDSQEQQQQQHGEQSDGGHSGEGSASALAHLKTQAKNRHPTNDAEESAGGTGGHAQ